MLIAIMADTFERVIDKRPIYSLKNKLMILATMASVISTKIEEWDDKCFMYVIQPRDGQDSGDAVEDSENWRGKMNYLKQLIEAQINGVREYIGEI